MPEYEPEFYEVLAKINLKVQRRIEEDSAVARSQFADEVLTVTEDLTAVATHAISHFSRLFDIHGLNLSFLVLDEGSLEGYEEYLKELSSDLIREATQEVFCRWPVREREILGEKLRLAILGRLDHWQAIAMGRVQKLATRTHNTKDKPN